MGIPLEVVGSLPRPTKLQNTFADYDAGKITFAQLQEVQDESCKESIQRMEQTGHPVVTDGEQRASSFATYPFTHTLAGTGLAQNLGAGGQCFAIFDDGHNRQLPRLVSGPFRYQTYAADYLRRSLPMATKPMKQAVIAPSMLYLLYPLDKEIQGYSREQFEDDLVNECEKDVRQCFEAGAIRVSIDFTEGRLSLKNDPNTPWTGRNMLDKFINLNNRVLDRFSAEERKDIGIHTCPGGKSSSDANRVLDEFFPGDCDSPHSHDVDYARLLPSLFKMNAGYFLIQVASEKDREKVYKLCGDHSRVDANGVAQVCFIGVTNPLNPRVETPEEVCDALLTAAKYIPKERLGATDDCGFSPFSIDTKPAHNLGTEAQSGPDFARDIAFQKIKARVQGAALASQKLGL